MSVHTATPSSLHSPITAVIFAWPRQCLAFFLRGHYILWPFFHLRFEGSTWVWDNCPVLCPGSILTVVRFSNCEGVGLPDLSTRVEDCLSLCPAISNPTVDIQATMALTVWLQICTTCAICLAITMIAMSLAYPIYLTACGKWKWNTPSYMTFQSLPKYWTPYDIVMSVFHTGILVYHHKLIVSSPPPLPPPSLSILI